MAKILVVGSANMDIIYGMDHLPAPGETILSEQITRLPGGKGANQAVAAARLGGDVAFLGRVGADADGEALIASLMEAGVDVSGVIVDEAHPTGTAVICVAESGENCIVVNPGANAAMCADDIWANAALFNEAEYVVIQLEIGFSAVQAAVTMSKMLEKRVILNPAPARELDPELLNGVYCLVPNEAEADRLFRGYTNEQLPVIVGAYGVECAVVTLGGKGAMVVENRTAVRVPTARVKAVDTTGAGDCFVGALTVALSEDQPLMDAVEFANAAASVSVTRKGAQASMPTREEIE